MKVTMYVKSISSCLLYFSGMFKEYFQIVSIFGMRQARDISLARFGLYYVTKEEYFWHLDTGLFKL